MAYFTNSQGYLFLCSDIPFEEKQKLDDYLQLLEESGVGKIIEESLEKHLEKGGRPSYNPYRLFAAILYAFSKHSGSLRRIEDSLKFDTRFMYLMEQKVPSYSTISSEGMFFAVMRDPGAVVHLPGKKLLPQIKLNKKYHIYDTLNKKYLGFGDSFRYGFLPETQALFTLLPYKAEKVLCNVKRSGRKVFMEITLQARSRKFCDHTFRVDIFDASGKKNPSYSAIVHGTGPKSTHGFTLPLNKNKVHKAVITELLTGAAGTVTF